MRFSTRSSCQAYNLSQAPGWSLRPMGHGMETGTMKKFFGGLLMAATILTPLGPAFARPDSPRPHNAQRGDHSRSHNAQRSEERRAGKKCVRTGQSRGSQYPVKKKNK